MRRPSSDRALRQLVAALGRAHPDDVAAVLGRLDPQHQGRARALVAASLGRPVVADDLATPDPPPPSPEETWPKGLSAWLLARLRSAPADAGPGEPAARAGITPMAQAALRASARALPPARPMEPARSPAASKPPPRWRALHRPAKRS
jgi:hypothetical protein